MNVFIGADHRGFLLKEKLRQWLEKDFDVKDMGAYQLDPNDSYPLFAERVASIVSYEQKTRGILLCGSGVGVDVVANKFDGARASLGLEPAQVKAGRKDDDMNILVIAADFTDYNKAVKMIDIFLKTKFDGKKRHKKRLSEIKKIEANN